MKCSFQRHTLKQKFRPASVFPSPGVGHISAATPLFHDLVGPNCPAPTETSDHLSCTSTFVNDSHLSGSEQQVFCWVLSSFCIIYACSIVKFSSPPLPVQKYSQLCQVTRFSRGLFPFSCCVRLRSSMRESCS